MNKPRSGFGKHTKVLKTLPRLHAKKGLGLFPGIQDAIAWKEIAFALQREVLRQPVAKAATKTVIRVAVFIRRQTGAGHRHSLRRHAQHRKLSADFKLLVIRLCAHFNETKSEQESQYED